jgi:hypothetical protein
MELRVAAFTVAVMGIHAVDIWVIVDSFDYRLHEPEDVPYLD